MAKRTVLYQTVFKASFVPPVVAAVFNPFTAFDTPQAPQFSAAQQQFSAWHSPFFGTRTPSSFSAFVPFDTPHVAGFSAEQQFCAYSGFAPPPPVLAPNTPFDQPQAPKYAAADQQFSAWHSPFFGTKTPITPDWTAFDEPIAPKYAATEQQFSSWHSPFFGTQTPSYFTETTYDAPQAPKYSAAEQQFSVFNGVGTVQTTLIAAFTSTPFDVAKAPQYAAAQQQFSVTDGFLPPPNPTLTPVFAPFDVSVAKLFEAAQQQYSAYVGFTPPSGFLTPNTPFDAPKGLVYPAGEQQFTAWHSPFFGTRTPAYLATFVPFDTPQVPLYPAEQQQFSSYPGLFVAAALTPTTLSQFYVDTTIPQLQVSPALLQFNDLPMGPEETIAPVEEVIIGRWGPDETKEERKRRHEAGLIFQHEELPTRSDFAPDPVEHPPHEPQKTVDEPANVRGAAPSDLAQVLREYDDPLDDPDIQDLVEWTIMYMQGYYKK